MHRYTAMMMGFLVGITVYAGTVAPSFAQAQSPNTATASATASIKAPVQIDLKKAHDSLLKEDAVDGLRSKVLFTDKGTTLIMLSFDKGGKKAEHTAPGIATLAVVSGDMSINVSGEPHDVKAGQLLVLQPNVTHNLTAKEASVMLVTIHRNEGTAAK